MFRRFVIFAAFLGVSAASAAAEKAPPRPAALASGLAIAAVVGEEALTSYDVENRLRFVIVTTNLSNTPEVIARLRPQIIRSLIDEKLQLAEAKKNTIEVEDDEVLKTISGLEAQRGMPPGAIFELLEKNRVPRDTFLNQVRAQMAWSRLLLKKIRPGIRISDEEAEIAQKKLSIPAVKQELEIGVLTLPVENKSKREGEVAKLAEKLVREIRSGASFEELSRQFSSQAATSGGKVATLWVKPEELHPVIGQALANAKVGSVTNALRTPDGFTIVKIYNARAQTEEGSQGEEVEFKDIVLTLKNEAGEKETGAMLAIAQDIARHPGSCEEEGVSGLENLDDFAIEINRRKERLEELPQAVRTILSNLQPGAMSNPFASARGIQLYMLCKRGEAAPLAMDKDRVKAMLLQQKMELEAQKYLRNLRRDTFIEVRQ